METSIGPKTMFRKIAGQAGSCLKLVRPEHYKNATPCTDWDLKQLLNHMIYEILWVPDIIAGKTVVEVGDIYEGDVVGDDARSSWQAAITKALAAVEEADLNATAHLSYGDVPQSRYIEEISADIFIHTWDVDQAMNVTLVLDPDVCQVVYKNFLPRKSEMASSGVYGKPVDVPDDAAIQTKLLALFGRKATGLHGRAD